MSASDKLSILEVEQENAVAVTDDVYVKIGSTFRRVPVSALLIASTTALSHTSTTPSSFLERSYISAPRSEALPVLPTATSPVAATQAPFP